MNRFKLVSGVAAALLLMNIALLLLLSGKEPDRRDPEGPRKIIIERLQLDSLQVKAYDQLIAAHRAAIREKEGAIMERKKWLYQSVGKEDSSGTKATLIRELGQLQMDIETIHYSHFLDIARLCRPDQQPSFGKLTADMAGLFRHGPPPGRKKP